MRSTSSLEGERGGRAGEVASSENYPRRGKDLVDERNLIGTSSPGQRRGGDGIEPRVDTHPFRRSLFDSIRKAAACVMFVTSAPGTRPFASAARCAVSLTCLAVAAAVCPYRVAASALSASRIRCPGGALERDAPNPAPFLMDTRRATISSLALRARASGEWASAGFRNYDSDTTGRGT